MKKSIESLLGNDHKSLDQLLTELDKELASLNFDRSHQLLDLFWARLAVHIRAENLHLLPAIANAPASLFTGRGSLPTSAEAHNLLQRLRSDHDFFMKELARTMKAMREIVNHHRVRAKEIEDVRQRMITIRKRLKAHNRLEEDQAYTWPSLLFDEPMVARLHEHSRHELENLPPRFA